MRPQTPGGSAVSFGRPARLAGKGDPGVDSAAACGCPEPHEGRLGEGRAIPARGRTLEGRSPGELRATMDLNRRSWCSDSRVEQGPGGERLRDWLTGWLGCGAQAQAARLFCGSSRRRPTTRGQGRRRRRTAAREEQGSEVRTPREDLVRNRASRYGAAFRRQEVEKTWRRKAWVR
jgi:hypothetical protein